MKSIDVLVKQAHHQYMNADDLRSYRNRWAMVEKVEQAELAQLSPVEKFADTAMLMRVARSLEGLSETEDESVWEVRRRWMKLAERLGV